MTEPKTFRRPIRDPDALERIDKALHRDIVASRKRKPINDFTAYEAEQIGRALFVETVRIVADLAEGQHPGLEILRDEEPGSLRVFLSFDGEKSERPLSVHRAFLALHVGSHIEDGYSRRAILTRWALYGSS